MHSDLLVTAIMPTMGRQGWAADAVRMFTEQTWERKELVVLDDFRDPSFPHFPRHVESTGLLYDRVGRLSIGEKRNGAVSRARGDVIIHWDSDDMYRADRIAHQVELLLSSGADLVGYNQMEFEEENGSRFLYHGAENYAIGVSFCYWRDIWEERRFDAVNTGEDEAFQVGRKVFAVPAEGRIVARIHSGNTANKRGDLGNSKKWEKVA